MVNLRDLLSPVVINEVSIMDRCLDILLLVEGRPLKYDNTALDDHRAHQIPP